MARITISEAEKRGFASRPTLYRAIKKGRITAHDEKGKKRLDVGDLVSVFGEPSSKESAPAPTVARDQAVEAARLEVERDRFQAETERLQRELVEERKAREEERAAATQERSEMREIIQSTQKLLEDQSRERGADRKGLLQRLREFW